MTPRKRPPLGVLRRPGEERKMIDADATPVKHFLAPPPQATPPGTVPIVTTRSQLRASLADSSNGPSAGESSIRGLMEEAQRSISSLGQGGQQEYQQTLATKRVSLIILVDLMKRLQLSPYVLAKITDTLIPLSILKKDEYKGVGMRALTQISNRDGELVIDEKHPTLETMEVEVDPVRALMAYVSTDHLMGISLDALREMALTFPSSLLIEYKLNLNQLQQFKQNGLVEEVTESRGRSAIDRFFSESS